jgi:toxin ParE1/3/4
MAYVVRIMSRAGRDLDHLFVEIYALRSDAALIWYLSLKKLINSLEEQPYRGPVRRKRNGLRHLLYGNMPHIYRVIYRVLKRQKIVEVLHVCHGARRKLKTSDLV